MVLKEDDIVLCTVKKIEGTAVFLKIEGTETEGHMILSEVAAGRIRNLRQYVSAGRLVVCKILKINPEHIELSLRRVTTREREAALDAHKKEKALKNVLKFLGEEPDKVINKIKSEHNLAEFFADVATDNKLLEKYVSKANAGKVLEVFIEKGGGKKVVEKRIKLKTEGLEGVNDIKYILDLKAEIHYLGSSVFRVVLEGDDFKEANAKMQEVLAIVEKRAKERKVYLEMEKEK